MAKKANNNNLAKAKAAKNDEFYTQISDIENEMNAYYDHDPNVFRGKTILCPCDDPEWSNFTKHFTQNFVRYGLKKLICTCYNKEEGGHGKMLVLTGDTNGNGKIEADDIVATEMKGNGDFNSPEVKKLLEEADFVITNPPFSLFREFITWIMESGKKFSIIGNTNAITYKEVFPLIKDNKVWLGYGFHHGNSYFKVPDSADTSNYAKGVYDPTTKLVHFRNCCWFTNIEHDKRHEPQDLCTKAQLKKLGVCFKKYDNYNAIDVPKGKWIPKDHKGVMGVPISWLDKYCPEQFEIIKFRKGDDDKDLSVNGECPYFRILIKHKS